MYTEELFGLKDKIAVVTGGNSGIGKVVAWGLAKAGAKIAILSRTSAEESLNDIAQLGVEAFHIPTDVTIQEQVVSAMNEVEKRWGTIDVVFNNAGIAMHKAALDVEPDEFRKVIDINLNGVYIVAREAAKVMIRNKTRGSIINTSSICSSIVTVPQHQAAYNSSKAAVTHLTRSLAFEWIEYGIRVNCLSPGYIGTPMCAVPFVKEEVLKEWHSRIPMGRLGKPEELIPAVLYMASNAAGYTTGADCVVDGGYTIP